ncbi:MAG: hypothetical protein K6A45_01345, partial [Lachnospiraceae bacterium]|nr:hypothetical protein [Lachnospiraceae bacterium]
FLLALYGGYTPLLIGAGFVLIFESNDWLKATVVKAFVLALCFSLCSTILDIIPDLLGIINNWVVVFGGDGINFNKLNQIIKAIWSMISFCKTILFVILALMALKMKTIGIGFVDKFVEKHLSAGQGQ